MAESKTAPRNPNDATFRNINALKRRVARLEANYRVLEARVSGKGQSFQPIGSRGRTDAR